MSKLKSLLIFAMILFLNVTAFSQPADGKADMADLMRSNGRIFVVVAVVVVILLGLILYLVRLDRKISKIEGQESKK